MDRSGQSWGGALERYRISRHFAARDKVKADDEAAKSQVLQRQRALLDGRYDLSDRPMPGAVMSGGRKHVQDGIRVKLPDGVTWDVGGVSYL